VPPAIPTTLRDRDIRAELTAWVHAQHADDPSTSFVPELGLQAGRVRVDLAVVNGSVHGYEIKSAADTLARLPAQAAGYSEVCDYVTIVATRDHLPQIRRIVPKWWGIVQVSLRVGKVELRASRQARRNPGRNAFAVAQLLWRDEALALLAEHQLDHGIRSKPRATLWRRLAANLDIDVLSEHARMTLRTRPSWRVDPPPA
jgi:hypothetical protein